MKVLFATANRAKVLRYKEALEAKGILLITIADLDFKLDIDENGKDALENAYIKAKAYYERTGIPTIGMEDTLHIEELPEEKQPGTHVRRINGRELNDEEMIKYYTSLAKEYGGKLTAKWVYGMVLIIANGINNFTWNKDSFYFVDKPIDKRNPGYPLDSISVIPEFNKYFLELTNDEKELYKSKDDIKLVVDFILDGLNK